MTTNNSIKANKDNDKKFYSDGMNRMMAESVRHVSGRVYESLEEAAKTVTSEEVELFSE